jgi:hypothetical protein
MTTPDPSSSFLPRIIYPSTAQAAANDLLSAVTETNTSVTSCTGLNATMLQNWQTWYSDASSYLTGIANSPPWFGLGTTYDQIEKYAAELVTWQSTLQPFCTITAPTIDPNAVTPQESLLSGAAQWGAVAVAAVAGAYVIGRVIAAIPRSPPKEGT